MHIGEKRTEPTRIRLVCCSAETLDGREIQSVEELASVRGRGVVWVHVTGMHDVGRIDRRGDLFGLHPLLREDISNIEQRPRLEAYGDYVYLAVSCCRAARERTTSGPSSSA